MLPAAPNCMVDHSYCNSIAIKLMKLSITFIIDYGVQTFCYFLLRYGLVCIWCMINTSKNLHEDHLLGYKYLLSAN